MKIILNLIILISIPSLIFANQLPRRGSLGVRLSPGSDNNNIIISEIFKNGTADNIGIMTGDTLLSIDGESIVSFQDGIDKISNTTGGISSTFKVKRGAKVITLSGNVVPMPFNVQNTFELSSFSYDGNQIRTILETPLGDGPFPVIYYIQGYPCASCEYTNPGMPIRRFIDDLVEAGYAVYRVEKPGEGDSRGNLKCEDIDFQTENEVFSKGYEYLQSLEKINRNKIVIFGHSMGGMHAPIISSKYKPSATVVYGIVTKDWYDYLLDIFTVQNPLFGTGYIEAEKTKNLAREFLYPIYFKSQSPLDVIKNESDLKFMKENLDFTKPDKFFGRTYRFFVNLNNVNIPEEWSKVKNKVLSLHGEHDVQALNNLGAKNVIKIMNYYNPEIKAEFIEVPDTEHIFVKVDSQKEVASMMTEGTFWNHASKNYNPNVAKTLLKWLREQVNE